MAYIELTDLHSLIPPQFLLQALDDDNDGVIDAWTGVLAAVQGEVDSLLEGRFSVPLTLDPMPRILKQACMTLACELCYRRRNIPDDQNPWRSQASAMRKLLMSIREGSVKLSVAPDSDAAVSDPAGSTVILESGLGRPGRILG